MRIPTALYLALTLCPIMGYSEGRISISYDYLKALSSKASAGFATNGMQIALGGDIVREKWTLGLSAVYTRINFNTQKLSAYQHPYKDLSAFPTVPYSYRPYSFTFINFHGGYVFRIDQRLSFTSGAFIGLGTDLGESGFYQKNTYINGEYNSIQGWLSVYTKGDKIFSWGPEFSLDYRLHRKLGISLNAGMKFMHTYLQYNTLYTRQGISTGVYDRQSNYFIKKLTLPVTSLGMSLHYYFKKKTRTDE